MCDLISDLNQRPTLLPLGVKDSLVRTFAGGAERCTPEVVRQLLVWCVQSMPDITEDPHLKECQVLDSLQHYRFGFHQAQRLIAASGATGFDNETVGLFTIVHDIGRLMVGSGASKPRYPSRTEGDILHPIVGAIMLREAFSKIRGHVGDEVWGLLQALIYTAERHTLSIGLLPQTLRDCGFAKLQIHPYRNYGGSLLLVDAPMAPAFARYAHLVALADLINNVSGKLLGVWKYRPVHPVPVEVGGRIDYVINGRDLGEFQVQPKAGDEWLTVRRLWKNGVPISPENLQNVRDTMKPAAIRFATDKERDLAIRAFQTGFEVAFR